MLMSLSAAVAIVFCLGLYRFVERPAQLFGKTFSYGPNAEEPGSIVVQRR
jgi:peptidoglycan/LPS O-acetylase OafA/YrhL